MGYTHYFRQRQSVPDIQWQALCHEVSKIFPLTQKGKNTYLREPIVICDASGREVITQPEKLFTTDEAGNQIILFNGDASKKLNHETFSLTQKCSNDWSWFCKTARKPYDFLATAILILANSLCPQCYTINSDGGMKEWLPVLKWLTAHTGTEYVLPITIYSNIFDEP